MASGQEYTVKLDLFEGPLDLLLYLVTKSEVAIADISVSAIAKQYLEYLDVMRELNIEVAAEYLSMAATLTRLKARELLPQEEAEALDEEEGIVSRQQLIEQLLEYKKFKEAAGSLRIYESEHFGSFARGSAEEIENRGQEDEVSLGSINVFDLISAFQRVIERAKVQEGAGRPHTELMEQVKLDDRIERIFGMLESDEEVAFEKLFEDDMRRMVLVVTFMAILELTKMQEITFRQETALGCIFVKRRYEKDNEESAVPEAEQEALSEEHESQESTE